MHSLKNLIWTDVTPTMVEKYITVGVWAAGTLIYMLFLKFMIPIYKGELRLNQARARKPVA